MVLDTIGEHASLKTTCCIVLHAHNTHLLMNVASENVLPDIMLDPSTRKKGHAIMHNVPSRSNLTTGASSFQCSIGCRVSQPL